MKTTKLAAMAVLVQLISGCCLLPPKSPSTVRVSDVINKVKEDLGMFHDKPILLKQVASQDAICKSADGQNTVQIVPQSIKLTLKTVAAIENDPSAGLVEPLGVLSIDPAYSGAYTRSNAQSLEIDLDTAELKAPTKLEQVTVDAYKAVKAVDNPLYATILSMGKELLEVDHTKLPCVKPTQVKSVIYFDVVNKTSGGIGIKVLGFKLGDKTTVSDEFHQVLEVVFTLAGSSTQLTEKGKVTGSDLAMTHF